MLVVCHTATDTKMQSIGEVKAELCKHLKVVEAQRKKWHELRDQLLQDEVIIFYDYTTIHECGSMKVSEQ
jgi:hypothetical protein